jgi:hypothetical protein
MRRLCRWLCIMSGLCHRLRCLLLGQNDESVVLLGTGREDGVRQLRGLCTRLRRMLWQ